MFERISLGQSAEEAISKLEDLLFERILEYRRYISHKKEEIREGARRAVSMIEDYIRNGNTKYVGIARIVCELPTVDSSNRDYDWDSRCYSVVEFYWSRMDLRDLIICLGIMGDVDYEAVANDPRCRFFYKVVVKQIYYSTNETPRIKSVYGLELNNSVLWNIFREIEKLYFGKHLATENIIYNQRLGRRVNHYRDTDLHPKFNRAIFKLKKFRETIISLFGQDAYKNQQIWHLFSTGEVLKVNKSIPAMVFSSKRSYFDYFITQKRAFLIRDPDSKEMKSLLSTFKSWSKDFFFKKIIPALVVSGRVSVIDDFKYII